MKIVRFFTAFLLVSLFTLSFVACEDDEGYSLGNFVISLATVNPVDEASNTYYLTMDNGTTLWPAASNIYYQPKKNQRVLVDFTLLSDSLQGYDHFVKINRMQEILTKQVIDLTAENESEIGNDPVKILEYWIGDHYLNIHFGYNSGGEKIHTISLVENKLNDNNNNNDNTVVLEFRHNKNGDLERYGVKSFAAFDLRKYQTEGQNSIDFLIKVRDFNNENKEYRVTYRYGNTQENLQNNKTINNMPEDVKYN